MNIHIQPTNKLSGKAIIPTSKSHTLRAILFASLAKGKSTIHQYLKSPDAYAMMDACRQLGAQVEVLDDKLIIQGVAGKPVKPKQPIDAGNSGQVLRFIGAIAGLIEGETVVTGDKSIRSNRPITPLIDGLSQMGATVESLEGTGYAPIKIQGPIQAGEITIEGQDSQPVSGLLMTAAFTQGETTIHVNNAGEKPWIGLTLDWFDRLGVKYHHENFEYYTVEGPIAYEGFEYTVPGDFSSLAYPVVAALVTQSEIDVYPVDMYDVQGDKKILSALESMGAKFSYNEADKRLKVLSMVGLQGKILDINDYIDAVTILAVVGCYSQGETVIKNASIARKKECDRLASICTELKKMGANIDETEDGLIVRQSQLKGSKDLKSYHDHRMVMSLAIAAMLAEGGSVIQDTACVAKSFPNFVEVMQSIGMNIRSLDEHHLNRP